MTVDAFIHPAFETVRVHVFSFQAHEALIPPVPLSGRHVQLSDRFQPNGGDGVTDAVKVTDCGPTILLGAAVTLNTGGVTVTWAESASAYPPIVAVAFIQPDRDTIREHVFSFQLHGDAPAVPRSGVQVQPDRLQLLGGIEDGVTVAANVTQLGPWMSGGVAVTLSEGGVTVIATPLCALTPLTVAKTVSVPERPNGRRQVRVPASTVTQLFEAHGFACVPNAGAHVVESICHGTLPPFTCPGVTLALAVTVSL